MDTNTEVGVRITKCERQSDGHYTARVSLNGTTIEVHNRHGSWMTEPDANGRMLEVPGVARWLVEKLPSADRAADKRKLAMSGRPLTKSGTMNGSEEAA